MSDRLGTNIPDMSKSEIMNLNENFESKIVPRFLIFETLFDL